MPYRFPNLSQLRTFEAAARHLSFKKAATELCVTPAAISQQIRALEEYLGVPLFRRRVRALELSEHGAAMLPGIRRGFDSLAEAIDATRRTLAGPLTIAAPPSFARHWLVPRLARFSAGHPEVDLRISGSTDTVDNHGAAALLDRLRIDPRSADSQVAILFGSGHYPGFRVMRVFAPDYVPICAPALLRRSPGLRIPADLAHQTLIHDDTLNGPDDCGDSMWQIWLRAAGLEHIDARRGPHYSDAALALAAAISGQGVVLASRPLVADYLRSGTLVVPFEFGLQTTSAYHLVMHESVARRPLVQAFITWLTNEAAIAST